MIIVCVFLQIFCNQIFANETSFLKDEIEFVQNSLSEFGFFPKSDEVIAYRGDGRDPFELQKSGGFFRKTFKDLTKKPSFRVDGGSRYLIGCSTDFTVATGFARYSVDVQRGDLKALDSGWVYAFFLPKNGYYDPKEYPHAFLADWAKELDAIYIPLENIIGAIHIQSNVNACIHSFLTRIPQRLHQIRGCSNPYINDIELEVDKIWINGTFSYAFNQEKALEVRKKMEEVYSQGFYKIKTKKENSEHAKRVIKKYEAYFPICLPFSCNDKELTALLGKEPSLEYIPDLL